MLNLNVLNEDTSIDCIAKSLEKLIMLKIGHIEIKDSLQFLNTSLDTLVTNLEDYADKKRKANESFMDAKKRIFKNTYEYFEKKTGLILMMKLSICLLVRVTTLMNILLHQMF